MSKSMENAEISVPEAFLEAIETADPRDETINDLRAEIKRLKTYVKELEQDADADPLIPVYNRRAFIRELSRAQAVLSRYKIMTSVIFFDLNKFKSVNDRYGHAIGDELLIKVGTTLQKNVRDCDLVARLGGDEFGVLLFKTDQLTARTRAVSLARNISQIEISLPTSAIHVSTSWGVSVVKADVSPERIVSEADADMFRNKRRLTSKIIQDAQS